MYGTILLFPANVGDTSPNIRRLVAAICASRTVYQAPDLSPESGLSYWALAEDVIRVAYGGGAAEKFSSFPVVEIASSPTPYSWLMYSHRGRKIVVKPAKEFLSPEFSSGIRVEIIYDKENDEARLKKDPSATTANDERQPCRRFEQAKIQASAIQEKYTAHITTVSNFSATIQHNHVNPLSILPWTKEINMTTRREVPGIKAYDAPAGGWGALRATAQAVQDQMVLVKAPFTLLRTNQPDGFDCPGCAWPDKEHKSTFQFCENGAKAVTWEATSKRVTPEFFENNTVSELLLKSDYELEDMGRLTHPLVYDGVTDKFKPVDWEAAFVRIGEILRGLSPDQVEFYTSGRASNEVAYLFQLFAREYGTNNFPDCSNMCHEATSVGLPQSIGIGKGTVSLDDFENCELIISIGHNPGTNHPRMMGTLHEASRRGVPIIVFNPLRERALERFADPQNMVEMATFGSTPIASSYFQVAGGGDAAALLGIIKILLDMEDIQGNVLDQEFINNHTEGFDTFATSVKATAWTDIEKVSGLTRADLEQVAVAYAKSKATIITYGMGVTQHNKGTANVRLIADLLLLRGNIGKSGAGICPLRGHSNVQGNRTVGITEKPSESFLTAMEEVFGFQLPRHHGHDAVRGMQAMVEGSSKAVICLGGNFAVALPDSEQSFPAMTKLDLSVHIGTKLNRSHLLVAKETFLFPCLGRTELDVQATGAQSITVEDSMSMVHASAGKLVPASEYLRSEPAIIAGMAHAALPNSKVPWLDLITDYDKIRNLIELTVPGFANFNARIRIPGGFRMPLPPTERIWPTPTGKAMFSVYGGVQEDANLFGAENVLRLITLRSHDQYNTTIYALDDRYRGVFGRRDVLFMNEDDLAECGLEHGDLVDIETMVSSRKLRLEKITAIAYNIARGSVGAYYPEANVLVPLDYFDKDSGTPSYKSVPVRVTRHPGS